MITIDFKITVFLVAAKHLNFTRAAQELNLSQPAVSKNIHELEIQAGRNLFERLGNRLELTEAGQLLWQHAQQMVAVYAQLNEDIEMLDGRMAGALRLGASTTLSHYIIPQILADFHAAYPSITIETLHGNSRQVEEWLEQHVVDLGIVEGLSDNVRMKYEPFFKDEVVLVTRKGNPEFKKTGSIDAAALKQQEFVIREAGSGTNEVIRKALMKHGIDWQELKVKVILASAESIKSFLLRTNCVSFLSVHAIARELENNELQTITLKEFMIERDFFFVRPQGVIGRQPNAFRKFAMHRFAHQQNNQPTATQEKMLKTK